MRTLRAWLMRAAGLFGSGARDRDLADEIESHLQLYIEDNIRAGLGPAEARRAALLKFGAVEEVKEQVRDRHGVPAVGHFARDVRYALRMMKKTPAFTTVAVAALARGIGVNTTVFSALDAGALRPLDVVHPEQLARVYRSTRSDPYGALSYPDYLYYRDHARTISDLAVLAFGTSVTSTQVAASAPAIVALFGLGLASLGVYGTVSYSVSQRAREIGIRMTLGADVSGVLRLIIQDGSRPVAWGVGAGLLLTALASKLLGSLLFGVGPFDVRSFVGASAVLVGVALVAIWLPARRATRVDPVVALRCE